MFSSLSCAASARALAKAVLLSVQSEGPIGPLLDVRALQQGVNHFRGALRHISHTAYVASRVGRGDSKAELQEQIPCGGVLWDCILPA